MTRAAAPPFGHTPAHRRLIQAAAAPTTRRLARLSVPIGVHTVADVFSFVTIALIPLLEVRLGLTESEKALTIGLGATVSGLIQPATAWLTDRFNARWIGTLGLALAAVLVPCIGLVANFAQFLTIYLVAAAGLGAFHPAAAAAVGSLAGERSRSIMLSLFFLAGMIGGMSGNFFTPEYVDLAARTARDALGPLPPSLVGPLSIKIGLAALVLLIPPGLAASALLARAIHRTRHTRAADGPEDGPRQRDGGGARWTALAVLWFCNVIRFSVNNALVYLTVEWTKALTLARAGADRLDPRLGLIASELNGPLQAAMQLGMGAGGLALGFFLARRHEKLAFVVIPAVGAVVILALPFVAGLDGAMGGADGRWAMTMPIAFALTTLAGTGFGSLIPVSLSVGQRLLPHRTGLASGVLLGGAWGFSIIGPQLARLIHQNAAFSLGPAEFDGLTCAYAAAGIGLLLAAAGALMLRTERPTPVSPQ